MKAVGADGNLRRDPGRHPRQGRRHCPTEPDAPPDPAFERLLSALRQKTGARIMLPAELPRPLENVAVDGALTASPEAQSRSNEYFEAARVEEVELPDGTEATLRYLTPVREKDGTQGLYWEGRFDKGGATYTLTIASDDVPKDAVVRALSSMVEVPQSRTSGKARTTPKPSDRPSPKK